ncbi:hypothetical protein GCM10011583_18300 [Streptomyces camponoticapitis]|uniref:Uncharacterized protein n=1 Tax=Streptomyces camponoticapitis TaxID=1616125 RepID=A0ABQ2E5R6_9ACTN|nr:hypothetical protein [Streptomyces camponoticapitis]GGJ87032.1 hypothetical protein GCM10011583_18300 [Streptomyces camponoticapitis]
MSIVSPERPTAQAPSSASTTPPRSWLRSIDGGGQIIEACPSYCTDHHRNDTDGALDDLQHGAYFDGTPMPVFHPDLGAVAMPVLAGRLNVDPYSEDPNRRLPHVTLEPWQDEVMETLNPDQFAQVIAQVRAQCDRLDEVHAQLVAARAKYGQTG